MRRIYPTMWTMGVLLLVSTFACAQKNAGRDQFFWLGQINKASAVINVDEGLLDRDKAPKIAAGIVKVLADGDKLKRQRELTEMDKDFQRRQREFREDLNQRKNEETANIVERANKVIKVIFETEKYDLILQDVVFAGPRVDITEKVIKALNAAPAGK